MRFFSIQNNISLILLVFFICFSSQAKSKKIETRDNINLIGILSDPSDQTLVLVGKKNYLLKTISGDKDLINNRFFSELYNTFISTDVIFGNDGFLDFGIFNYNQNYKSNYSLRVTVLKEKDTLSVDQKAFLENYKFTCKISESSSGILEKCFVELPIEIKFSYTPLSDRLKPISHDSVKTVYYKTKGEPFYFLKDAPTAVVVPIAIPLMVGLCAASHISGETKRGEHCRFPFG